MTPDKLDCATAMDRLQRRLDGDFLLTEPALDWHLADCDECAGRFAMAERLLRAYPVRPSRDFAAEVQRTIRADRRQSRLRWAVGATAAMAAAIMLAVGLAWPTATPAAREVVAIPSLDGAVADAASVVRTWAGKVAIPDLPDVPAVAFSPAFDPAVTAVADAGRGIAVSVSPITDSARRAATQFWRDLPTN
ncbi:MAG: hypothetical protein K1X57_03900 [Gemmataceae bacterium]|nr:hypothetical protein [Gemmataceae bacterium]